MKQSKIGMIGCGMISEVYAKNITERFGDLQLVACADLRMEAAQARAEQFGTKAMTVDELLADTDIDIVLNLTIPDQHAAVSMAALKAGKNVYSEKPLAIHMQDAKELVEYAKAHNLLLGTAPDTFMGGGLQTCRQLLDADTIGTPIAAQAFMMSRGPEAFHPNPKFFYEEGAGPVLDWGPYYITALVSLLGSVKSVVGRGKITYPERTAKSPRCPYQGQQFPVEVPTYVTGILTMESGALVNLTISFDMQFAYWDSDMPYLTIYGSKGSLNVPDMNKFEGPVTVRRGDAPAEEVPVNSPYTENCRGLGLADMAHALQTGKAYRPSTFAACDRSNAGATGICGKRQGIPVDHHLRPSGSAGCRRGSGIAAITEEGTTHDRPQLPAGKTKICHAKAPQRDLGAGGPAARPGAELQRRNQHLHPQY